MYLKSRKIGAAFSVIVVTTALAGCDIAVKGDGGLSFDVATAKAQDEWTRTYKLAAGGRLEIINVNGKISAEAGEGPDVEIRAERSTRATSEEGARDLLKRLEMREEIGEGRVRVEVRGPRMTGMSSSHTINWSIKVPKGVAVDLRTINGGVHMARLDGTIRARATNGGIVGTGLVSSAVDAAVTNGGVDIALANAPSEGTFELESVNGGVAISLPAESRIDVAARAVNGGINVNGLEFEVLGEQTRRRLDGKLNGGGARVSLETVNGGVKISRATT